MRQVSAAPTNKVIAGGVTAAVTILAVSILKRYGVEVSTEEAQAGTMILSFIASYFTPPSDRDVIVQSDADSD